MRCGQRLLITGSVAALWPAAGCCPRWLVIAVGQLSRPQERDSTPDNQALLTPQEKSALVWLLYSSFRVAGQSSPPSQTDPNSNPGLSVDTSCVLPQMFFHKKSDVSMILTKYH